MWTTPSSIITCVVALLCSVPSTLAQQIGFTVYPQQVLTGLTYQVAWQSNGQPVTIQLVRNGAVEETLFTSTGSVNTFQWIVEDDADGGTDYTLNLVSNGQTIAAPIWVIEDEDGLVVSGTTITAPSPTAVVTGVPTVLSFPVQPVTTTTDTASTSATTTPATSTPEPTESNAARPGGGLAPGAIAGIVVGVVAVFFILLGLLFFYRRRRQAARSGHREDTIRSFLALRGGGSHRIAHGTSPEVKQGPGELSGEGGEKSMAALGVRESTITAASELDGGSYSSWNAGNQPQPSVTGGTFEADGREATAPLHELPGDEVQRPHPGR